MDYCCNPKLGSCDFQEKQGNVSYYMCHENENYENE